MIRYVARNRRARHDYDILETYECGIALKGAEVKSLRLGQASLQDAYARIDDGELWLVGAHLAPYEYASGYGRFDPVRARKLLLHRREIDELAGRVAQKALTLVPLSIYFKDGLAKVEIALARGRRLYDKRHAIAERDATQRGPAHDPRARAPPVRPPPGGILAKETNHHQGGDRLRLRMSSWEKRAVVSGATLKSRKTTQTPSLSSRLLPN